MEIDVEEFDRVTSTNLRGTFVGCQTIGRYFSQRQQGSIINLASLTGQNGGTASGAHYAASKGGIITLTKVFARALSNAGVSVNAIAPGPLDLPSVRAAVPEEKMPALLEMIPMKRQRSAAGRPRGRTAGGALRHLYHRRDTGYQRRHLYALSPSRVEKNYG